MIFNQKMNEDDWQNLSTLWGTLNFRSLEKLIDIKVYNAAQLALTASTMEEVADQRGYARGLKEILKEIERADKRLTEIKNRKESNAKEKKEKR
jgi:hypothetical protein